MKKSHMEAKLTKSFENISKLKGNTQNFEKKLNNSSKKLKVSANPLGLLAENRSKKKPGLTPQNKPIKNYQYKSYQIKGKVSGDFTEFS